MGLLSNLLNDNSGKKAAGSVSDMEKSLASDSLITMDAEQWITIHPNGEGDNRHIQIDDQTGEILKGGAMALQGTNIKDFGKNMKDNKPEIEGGRIKTKEEFDEKRKKVKKDLDDIYQLIESDKREDLDKAEEIFSRNGAYGFNGVSDISVLEAIREYKPKAYSDILDTSIHHQKDVETKDRNFADAFDKWWTKARIKNQEARQILKKLESSKNNNRLKTFQKQYDENKELLKHLRHGEVEKLNSLKEWAKSKIYGKK